MRTSAAFIASARKRGKSTDFACHVRNLTETAVRNQIQELNNLDLRRLEVLVVEDPTLAFKLNRHLKSRQKAGDQITAAGMMVWLHSARALSDVQLRAQGRAMWAELSRGFGGVPEAAADIADTSDRYLDIAGFDDIPDGLGPRR